MTAEKKQQITKIDEQLRLLKRQTKAALARNSLMDFIKFTMPDPEDPADADKSLYHNALHHDAIARVVEEVEKGEIQFLILTVPPRHGKSEIVSRRLPAWYLGRNPRDNVVVATYNDDFAKDFGADVRSIMKSPQYRTIFPHVTLQTGGAAKERLQTKQGGMATFVGVGGSLTGRGAHLLVIDDVIKDYEQARSQAFRDRAWEWFTKVAMTRRMGRKLVIITFTRWHTDDIIGRLTDPENEYYNRTLAEKIRIINFPAIAEEGCRLGRVPGEPLWPDRYDIEFFNEQRMLDPLGFEALYQQRPTLADGVLFRRENVRFYDSNELDMSRMRVYCASDHAVSTSQRADSTVLLRVGLDPQNNIYLLDCWWRKSKTDEVVEAMLAMGRQEPRPLIWWAEKGHISKSIGPFLRKRMSETQTYFSIVEVTPAADKEQRAQAIAARMAMGYVHFPKDKPWTERAINELLAFPNGLHDDFCLAADTQVTLADGTRRRIDAIREGDLVATPEGPCRVAAAVQTSSRAEVRRVWLSDGRVLVATGNHPVFVAGKGFVCVDALAYDDVLFDERQDGQWQNLRCSSTAGTDTAGIPVAPAGTTGFTSTPQSPVEGFCTGTFGRIRTDQSRPGLKSITRMATRSTTTPRTWNSWPFLRTALSIFPREADRRSTSPTSKAYVHKPGIGTAAPKAEPGTPSTVSSLGWVASRVKSAASAVAQLFRPTSRASVFATTRAVRVTGVEALTTPQPVYNLAVENSHMFYANGVLTHNCDALAYVGLGLQAQIPVKRQTTADTPAKFGTFRWVKEQQRKSDIAFSLSQDGGF